MSSRGTWSGLLALCVLAGCGGEEGPDFAIERNQRADESTCELSPRRSGSAIERGTFDVALGDRSAYVLTPLVRNSTGSAITVTHARVAVDLEAEGLWGRVRIRCDLGASCEEWDLSTCNPSDPSDCPVVPAGGTDSFEAPILPRLVTAYFQGMLDAAAIEGRTPPEFELRSLVRLVGTNADGDEVVSAEFVYEVTMCLGCLVDFPPGSDSAMPGVDCCAGGAPITSCQPGQDDPIDCRLCRATAPEVCGGLTCD
jgi:hypothetical protein